MYKSHGNAFNKTRIILTIKTITMKTRILAFLIGAALLVASTSYASNDGSSKSANGYVVHSVIDGRKAITAYDKKGKWVYTIQQYSIDNLDKNIVDRVRSVYYDYGVTAIQKVEQPGMDEVYIVHIENTKSLKLVRLTRDEMEVVQDLTKG
jgi:lactam utilization protein B